MVDKILFVCGSLNQTTMMHQIAQNLPQADSYFTPYFAEGVIGLAAKAHLADFSILGGRHQRATLAYLHQQKLKVDSGNKNKDYDLVVTGSDLIIPRSIQSSRLLLVQEGMLEKAGLRFELVKQNLIPRWFANTAAMGLSQLYDVFCVASEGYRQLFISRGIMPEKLVVTGIPNFDNAAAYLHNHFEKRGYVLVATSSIRETMKPDKRMDFLLKVKQLAKGKEIIFKLHPNEEPHRAIREIRSLFPKESILINGNLHEMIANSAMLIAQNSSAIFTALALGKQVYSDLDEEAMLKLLPLQNGGNSARLIAEQCHRLLASPLDVLRPHAGQVNLQRFFTFKFKKESSFKLPVWFS
ncbi:MAG: hypothetical protein VB108_07670 [Anaerolineaceae bacterium]|nr:hypothetical protein [Anaerolineaceae bacterium]